jgi:hypothetical protein
MPENFPAGQFLRKADKCFGDCKAVYLISPCVQYSKHCVQIQEKTQPVIVNMGFTTFYQCKSGRYLYISFCFTDYKKSVKFIRQVRPVEERNQIWMGESC